MRPRTCFWSTCITNRLLDPKELLETLHTYRDMIAPYVCDVSSFLWNALKEGKEILLEGQLGTLKDPDHGIYPMVTSSSTLAAYGAVGAGIRRTSPSSRWLRSARHTPPQWGLAHSSAKFSAMRRMN